MTSFSPPPTLSVIIVNWNTSGLLGACLASIARETPDLRAEIIVVDNASTDGSAAFVRERFPAVQMIESGANRGYAGGNNLALGRARGQYIALLNPDTVVEDRALERLVAFLAVHPAAGGVGPKLVHPAGRYAIHNGGWQPSLGTVFAHYSGLSRLLARLFGLRARGLHTVLDQRQRVGWLSGACLVVRCEVVEQVGPLLEERFLYAEDVEWCDRITALGWELWYEPEARVVHLDRQSTGQRNGGFSTLWVHGLRQHYAHRARPGRARLCLFDAILAGGLLSRAALYLLRAARGRGREAWLAEARSFARGGWEVLRLGGGTR